MSGDMNQSLGDSGRAAARGAGAAGRAGAKAARSAIRKGRKTASAALPLKVKIAIALILAFVLLIATVGGGTSSSQMDENFYYTAMDEEKTNKPDTEEDAKVAMYDMANALKQTTELATIIHEAKREERQKIEAQIGKDGENVTVVCETDSMPIYINSEFPTFVGSGSAGHAAAEWGRARAAEAKGKWYYVYYGSGGTGPNGVKSSKKCPICHPQSNKYGWQCIGFVTACYYHGAGVEANIHDNEHCYLGGLGTGASGTDDGGTLEGRTPEDVYRKWKARNGENWQMISTGSLKSGYLEASQLQEGDVLLCYNNSGHCFHMAMYIGNNEYVDSSRGNSVNPGKGGVQINTYGERKSVRIAMRYTGGSSSSLSGSTAANGGEAIALTAEKYAWPLGTNNKKYDVKSGGKGYNGFTAMYQNHIKKGTNSNIQAGACSCHSANAIASEALGVGGYLPSLMTPSGETRKRLENRGFVVMNFNGSTSELQRGDILTYRKTDGGSHVFIYLGKNKWGSDLICDASQPNGYFPHISKWSKSNSKEGKSTYLIIRYTGSAALFGTTSYGGYSPKTGYTEIGTITRDTGTRYSLSYPSDKNTAQSFTYTNGSYAVAFTNGPQTKTTGIVRGFSSDGRLIRGSDASGDIYHGNGTCCSADGTVLVAGSLKEGRKDIAVEFSNDNGIFRKNGDKRIPVDSSAIAYDKETGNYVFAKGSTIYIYDSSMTNLLGKVDRNMHGTYYQDIGAGGGYVFSCHSVKKGGENSGENYIDVYDESSGAYCGSYYIDYGELESADIVNGELILLVHIKGSRVNYIHKTGIIINAGAGGVIEGVTKSDLDILAAYSVTLSNSGLYKQKDGDEKTEDSTIGLFSTERYTDINGKKIKTYRLGEKKGRINYPKDLKSRIKDPLRSFRLGGKSSSESGYEEGSGGLFYKVLRGDKAIEAMKIDGVAAESAGSNVIYLQERPVSYICDHLFLIDPNAKYSGASNLKRAKSNLAAIYAISDNTEHLLYTGTMDPSLLGASGGIYGTGSLALPLPPGSFTITSHVGTRESPGAGASTNHKGLDMGCPTGTPIYAALAGQVTTASWYGGYGNCVIIESGNTEIIYGHMSKILTQKGTYVTQGQNIGLVGNTGISFGSHLHFEVHQNGKVIDPEPLLGLR